MPRVALRRCCPREYEQISRQGKYVGRESTSASRPSDASSSRGRKGQAAAGKSASIRLEGAADSRVITCFWYFYFASSDFLKVFRIFYQLVDLSPSIYAPDECIRCQEAHSACHQRVHNARKKGIAEEQHARYEALDVQPRREVPHAVDENPERASPSHEKALPPPVIVLVAQLHVGRDDCHLADRDSQDGADEAEEAKHVVVAALVLPDTLEHEQQLDEEYCEWN
jgi:hypothetical protein